MGYDAPIVASREKANGEAGMLTLTGWGILLAAFIALGAIWLVVLVGSRYFGPH